jgi:hypothetical protein
VLKLDEIIPVNGVVIHAQTDWPCSGCRPAPDAEDGGTFLCVKCAIALTAASIRRIAKRPGATATSSANHDSEMEEGQDLSDFVPPAQRQR